LTDVVTNGDGWQADKVAKGAFSMLLPHVPANIDTPHYKANECMTRSQKIDPIVRRGLQKFETGVIIQYLTKQIK